MTGIFGCLSRSKESVSEAIAVDMANAMKHEDQIMHTWILNSCLLGKTELRFSNNEKDFIHENEESLLTILMGKIYNRTEVAEKFRIETHVDDTTLVTRLYKKIGSEFGRHLNGLFVAAIFDEGRDRCVIINDRHGFFPVFYALSLKRFIFASEIKAILKDSSTDFRMNRKALSEFFVFKFLLNDETFFKGIRYMPPANVLVYDRRKDDVSLMRYWAPAFRHTRNGSLMDYQRTFGKLMKKAIECRVKDRKEVGVLLSGGLDSRLVSAFASKTGTPMTTFTLGVKGCLQQKIAKQVAERLGVPNIFLEIPADFIARYADSIIHKGDGLVRIRDCHFVALLKTIRKKTKMVLLGTGGGELFGQTLPSEISALEEREQLINYWFETKTRRGRRSLATYEEFEKVFLNSFYNEARDGIWRDFHQSFEGIEYDSLVDIIHYWEISRYLPRSIFQAFQYLGWYIEARYPFLDNDLVEFAFSIPPSLKVEEAFLQKTLSFCFPSLSDIPWEKTGVPPDSHSFQSFVGKGRIWMLKQLRNTLERITKGKKSLGPVDYRGYSQWLRTGSREYVEDILLSRKTLQNGFFRAEYVKQAVREHMEGVRDRNELICDLVNFELTNREFFCNKYTR